MNRTQLSNSLALLLLAGIARAQPCLVGYTLSQTPPPVNGTYGCGETVTFCFTVTNWNSTNANWFHGIVANFGPGWDLATLTPGTPPPSCFGNGTWAWYPSVQGTAGTNIGPQGPGFFYNYTTPADADPGNNFGDFCTGPVNWQFCWTISVLSPPACVSGMSLSVSFNTFADSETGSWGSAGCGLDPIVPSTPAVIQACSASAGIGGPLTLCSSSPPSALFNALGGAPQAGGTWTNPGGAPHLGILDPAVDGSGNYTYTVTAVAPPCSQSAVIAVTIVPQPDAGSDGSITWCASDAAFDLFTMLGGSPDAGGAWTGPAGASSGTFDPAVDAAGAFTYTLIGTPPCVNASATVIVTVNPSPFAGVGGPLILCSNSPPILLSTGLIGNDPGGSWFDASGALVNGSFDASTDPPGDYTYTVAGMAPCPNSSATVNVTVNQLPSAGSDAAATLCTTAGSTVLTSLLGGTPGVGGAWTDPNGQAIGASVTPSNAPSGNYTYTVTGGAPCPNASATLTLTINVQPSAGSDATVNLCTASAPIDLFVSLGGTPDAGGTWSGPNGPIANTTFTPGTSTPGAYTYSVTGQAPCVNASATVTVNVSAQPSAGISAPLSVCSSSGVTALLPSLGATAQPGGAWTGPGGAPSTGSFTPGTSADGDYTYTISGIAPCPNSSATVTVTTVPASNAGSNGALTICSSGAAASLINSLGGAPGAGGTWTAPGGGAMNGTLNPATAAAGDYTYTLAANGPCPAVSAQVNVTIAQAVSAGANGSQSLCSSDAAPFNLISALGGSPTAGGSWTDPSGATHGPTFTTASDAPGAYTYTVNAAAPCPSASSTVSMSVVQAPVAGNGGPVSTCANAAATNPFNWLTGNPDAGGSWTDPGGGIIAQVNPATASSGNYTYTVNGTAPCPNAQAVIALIIDPLPNAGADGILNICINGPSTSLLPLLSGAQPGGAWLGPAGAFSGTFVPGQAPPGSYAYTVSGSGACSGLTDQSEVQVTVNPLPVPSFTVDVDRGCAPLSVAFTNTTPGTLLSAGWNLGDGTLANGLTDIAHTYMGAGQRDVTLTVTDANGCTGSITVDNAVLVSSGPSAAFFAQPMRVSVNEPTTTVVHEAITDVDYDWTIDDVAVDTSGTFHWTFDPATIGYHEICVLATDSLDCFNTNCLRVLVDDDLTVFVPNAFTPNSDGKNEVWRPSVIGVEEGWYSLRVFDRWGLEVFSTDDPAAGWNGTLNNGGDPLPQDVYVWVLKAKDQFTPEKADLIGTVSLLR